MESDFEVFLLSMDLRKVARDAVASRTFGGKVLEYCSRVGGREGCIARYEQWGLGSVFGLGNWDVVVLGGLLLEARCCRFAVGLILTLS
jgi:hypothetical protein